MDFRITDADMGGDEKRLAGRGSDSGRNASTRRDGGSRSHRTLRTLLARLVDKGVVSV